MIQMQRRRCLAMSSAAALAELARPFGAMAQSPVGPTKILCGFPAGDAADIVARQYGERMRGSYAPVVIVDNRTGAGGRLAVDALRREPADGSALLLSPSSMLTIAPHVLKALPYDPLKDFAPISKASVNAFALSVGPMVPASVATLADFLAWCRANPGLANYATSGVGTTMHLLGANFSRLAGVKINMVPYKGGSPAANDLVGGQVAAVMSTLPGVLEFARAGRIRVLAVSSPSRSHALPSVPTFAESGFPDLTFVQWFGVFAPAGTPRQVVEQAHAAIQTASRTPELKQVLDTVGLEATFSESPAKFAEDVRAEHERWRNIVRAIGFKPEA